MDRAAFNGLPQGVSVAYVHFPFCRNICDFCGYETRLIDKPSLTSFGPNLVRQIDHILSKSNNQNLQLEAVFFGGGTASLMPTEHLSQITERLLEIATDRRQVELTLECEPGTISKSSLRAAQEAGVNRISVCAQSFDDQILSKIGRKHNSRDSYQLIEDCISLGFANIHVDLMYGLPGQNIEDWRRTLETVAGLPIHHTSAYKLYVFKHGQLHRGAVVRRPEYEPDPYTERCKEMNELPVQIFADAGLHQYSLTEFSKKGMECRYVKACFDGSDVMPIGPSAFGRCDNEVWDNSPYAHLFENADFGREHDRAIVLSPHDSFKRGVLLGLWLLTVDLNFLSKKHGVSPSVKLLGLLTQLADEGWLNFGDMIIGLREGQRFLAGVPMEKLAGLDANDWCAGVETGDPSQKPEPPSKLTQRRLELNFVLRMARRDPQFFHEVNKEPLKALLRCGYNGDDAELEILVNAISDNPPWKLTEEEMQLRELWKLLEKEHRRSLKAQQIAGLQ